ncbi:N-acetylglucosamine-6-phosphate deacetylase [Algibacillus agarilyticus]|uniref:N-acetylglucosamine-6-phosphate deacetylase n=1 Tax=Algibacillus agarilyticus TaxID=2234133 RepID=UPI000DD00E44|nr:N-acetylglucosamine-6-phosphate deacetylase [Algibacillus agarilyticus]
MPVQRIHAAKLFNGEDFLFDQVLTIEHGKIVAIDNDLTQVDKSLHGLVVPGFIDLQVNGGGGVLFNSTPTVEGLATIMQAHAKYGTTAMLPTLITDTIDVMRQAADSIAQAIAENVPGIIGVHFEGPHLSVAKKGAHSAAYIRPISDAEWQVLSRQDLGKVIVTLAPENVLPADIEKMLNIGIHICLGHTNADYATAQKAIDNGASGFTHLFNAMSPWLGREPGVVGAALLNDQTSCGLIVDGQHVDYTSCQLAIKTKPAGKIFLVTDAMPPVGTADTEFAFFDRTVYLADGQLTSTTGELAGSVLDMATAVRNTVKQVNLPLADALKMAARYPADYIKQLPLRGVLAINSQADFVELDEDQHVLSTWINGEQVYSLN